MASSLGVASRTTVLKLADAILQKNAAAALAHVRELASRGANLESLGRDLLETLRNLAVAKLPAGDADSPLDDIPDHEVAELKRLAAGASARDIMRLFRLMADSQEQILKSPYPDLLLEMAVVRMASLAAVIDADELLRAIGSTPPASGTPPASSGGGSGEPRGGEAGACAESAIERCAADAGRGRSQSRRAASPVSISRVARRRCARTSRAARFYPRQARGAGRLHGAGRGTHARRRRSDGHGAQRHLHSLSERQQERYRGACERASRPRDSRRAFDQRRGESCRRRTTMPLASNGLTRELPRAAPATTDAADAAENAPKRRRRRGRSNQSEKLRPHRQR